MKVKRLFALLMSLVLIIAAMSGLGPGVEAADTYQETNSYVLNYNGQYEGCKWQYFSPYWPSWTYEGKASGTAAIAFTLYDTVNAVPFAVYCMDIAVGLDSDSNFRRINLEDSTYSAAAAGLLRSIVRQGYPNTDLATLGAAAGVTGLTVGEAVAATQTAIWQAAHGERVNYTDLCATIDTDWNESATANFDLCYAEIASGYAADANKETIRAHIAAVYDYLIHLEPTAPTGVVASEASFLRWDSVLTDNGDGTFDVTATATVEVHLGSADSLSLSVVAGDYSAAVALEDGEKTYTLTLENVPAEVAQGSVTLAIDGVQAQSDVYLFDAEGGRGESQSLIGITGSALPVHAEVNANDRILRILKTDGEGKGLQNITFDLYYVCDVDAYLKGELQLGTGVIRVDGKEYFSAPTAADIANYVTGKVAVASITTDETGTAVHNFGNDNDGIYIVCERENAVTTGAVQPFFIAVPGGASAAAGDVYEILVQPKNTLVDEDVEIEKDVVEIGQQEGSMDVGQVHTWIIQSTIPSGLATGLRYEITDVLDYRLTYLGNIRVGVAQDDGTVTREDRTNENETPAYGESLWLTEGTDYSVTTGTMEDAQGHTVDSFTVALTSLGMEKVAEAVGEAWAEYELRVYFDAAIISNAVPGEEIPNQAEIHYTNNVGRDYEGKSDIPVVYTGGLRLHKVDASDTTRTLAGASFRLARLATETEVAEGLSQKLTVDGVELDVVYVSFHTAADLSGETVTEVTTGESGEALFYCLAYGSYYLVETAAPEGYNLLPAPVAVTIDGTSHLEEQAVTVKNSAKFQLPETGGMGTTLFLYVGCSLVAVALVLAFVLGRRKQA